MKVCSKCKIEKDLSEFRKDKTRKDGMSFWCKVCMKKTIYDWHHKNIDHVKEYDKKRAKKAYYNLKDGKFYVYLIPNNGENYVGCTDNPTWRKNQHTSNGKNTKEFTILGTFNTREEALSVEKQYHDKGYAGKHSNNMYK